ncbi:MAG: caspase family protein [Alphaproteobacteria bacterium]
MTRRAGSLLPIAMLAAALGLPLPAAAETWGLVIGIDRYERVPALTGAVNDAHDVAGALRSAGARHVMLLTDGEATRASILGAWKAIVAGSSPGDLIVFHYAGHGGQEPERVRGNEEDGKDETFLLAGFGTRAPHNAERIVDDEVAEMLAAAGGRTVVLVADSCHSGTMTRGMDPRATFLRTRFAPYGRIEDDMLPPPSRPQATRPETDHEHVLYLGATADDKLTPELLIDGQPRGALSYTFARALAGAADENGDRKVDVEELRRFVIESVRVLSEGQQLPRVGARGAATRMTLPTAGPAAGPALAEAKVTVRVSGGGAGLAGEVAKLPGVTLASGGGMADLVWDVASGQVVGRAGDVVAGEGVARLADFAAVADKWRLLAALRGLAGQRSLAMRIEGGDSLHKAGEVVEATFRNPGFNRLTVFNLAQDGTVQHIAPAPSTNPLYSGNIAGVKDWRMPLRVTPPFGADNLVAFVTNGGMPDFERVLAALDGKRAAGELIEALRRQRLDGDWKLGTVGLYTTSGR